MEHQLVEQPTMTTTTEVTAATATMVFEDWEVDEEEEQNNGGRRSNCFDCCSRGAGCCCSPPEIGTIVDGIDRHHQIDAGNKGTTSETATRNGSSSNGGKTDYYDGYWFFSETEKIGIVAVRMEKEEQQIDNGRGNGGCVVERVEELCSVLWNQIKDATVLDAQELSNSLLAHLQIQTEHLADQIDLLSAHQQNTTNAQLRLATVWSALEQLKQKRLDMDIRQRRRNYNEEKEWTWSNNNNSGGGGEQLAMWTEGKWCGNNNTSSSSWMWHIRKWLNRQEMELTRIQQRIPYSRNSMASLKELEFEQRALQEQIQNEGRDKHQQLCSAQQQKQQQQNHHSDLFNKGREEEHCRRLCETLEHRYLALWLASLESLELIAHFKAELTKKHIVQRALLNCEELDEEEEGCPERKRRKTANNQLETENKENNNNNNNNMGIEQQQLGEENCCGTTKTTNPLMALPTAKLSLTNTTTTTMNSEGDICCCGVGIGQQQEKHGNGVDERRMEHLLIAGSDIGYSSGENNSVHEECCNGRAEIVENTKLNAAQQNNGANPMEGEENETSKSNVGNNNNVDVDGDCWAEQIAHSSELEKSYYRTVPLDEFGMTDNEESSNCCWQRSGCPNLVHKLMLDASGEGGGNANLQQQLTDSLIVHVDNTPEENSRHLHDFEEVMDLLDEQQQQLVVVKPMASFIDADVDNDDCDSLSSGTEPENGTSRGSRQALLNGGNTRKRTAGIGKIMPKELMIGGTTPQLLGSSNSRRRQGGGRRKLATVRRSRTLGAGGWWTNNNCCSTTTNINNSISNYVSSDFEWDEDFGKPFDWNKTVGGIANNNNGDVDDVELPELGGEVAEEEAKKHPLLFARKKALCAFRNGLRKAAADSGMVSVQLQELLALVDKSLGGVHSAKFLLTELNGTFHALSRLYGSLETKMLENREFGNKTVEEIGMKEEEEKENQWCNQHYYHHYHHEHIPMMIKQNNGSSDHQQQNQQYSYNNKGEDIQSELMLCHERMNALETTCNNLALLLGTHLADGNNGNNNRCTSQMGQHAFDDDEEDNDYLAQFAMECNRIKEELKKLKSRFNEKFVFCTIGLSPGQGTNDSTAGDQLATATYAAKVDCFAQTSGELGIGIAAAPSPPHTSFWRSYLLLCLIGFIASFGTLLYAGSRDGTDWRWTFGPQLHYRDGPPPV